MAQKKNIYNALTGEATVVDYTTNEQASYDDYNSTEKVTARKLEQVKETRLEKLIETDFYALGDVTMSDAMKTYRQNLRDIPANYVDEAAYDLLLARDPDTKELTHSVWSKP